MNGSVMNGSVMNVVCFEWSVMNGLFWTGLFWTDTVWSSAGLTIVANVAIATGPAVFYNKSYSLQYM